MADELTVRPAVPDDAAAIARVWHTAWRDGHVGKVPDELLAHRTLDSFASRVPERIATSVVAVRADGLVGFATVHEDELEQLFVDREARGTGVAVALIDAAERAIAGRFATAWLSVVAGNTRARRFYERLGWHDAGPLVYEAQTESGTFPVPSRRYEKRLVG